MLGKLIKHELKNTYLEIVIINVLIIVFSVISGLIFNSTLSILLILPISSLFILYIAAYILLIINIIKSINQKLFTNEGYLTLTIPVSIDKILISKILVNFIWWLLTIAVTFFSLFTTVFIIFKADPEILKFFSEISFQYYLAIFIYALNSSISILNYIVILLLTLCILNIGKIKKMKLLIGFIIFYMIKQILSYSSFFLPIIPFTLYFNGKFTIGKSSTINLLNLFSGNVTIENYGLPVIDFTSLLFNVVAIVLFYILSRKLITTKLELE